MRARALADSAALGLWVGAADSPDRARQALAIAREVDDPVLLARALTTCGLIAGYYDPEEARGFFAEAIGLARASDDRWWLSQILAAQAIIATIAGDLLALRAAAEEGRDLADALGDRLGSRTCRACLGIRTGFSGRSGRCRRTIRRAVGRGPKPLTMGSLRRLIFRIKASHWRSEVKRLRRGPPPTRPSRPPPSLAGLERASPTGRQPPRPWPPAMLRQRRTRPTRPGHT